MRIKIQQFLFGKSHSWSIVGQNIGRAFLRLGHDVEFISTDGFDEKFCPLDLRPYVREEPTGQYDMQLSYTATSNWPHYLKYGTKNKFAIWNYEYNSKSGAKKALLEGFGRYHHFVNKVFPSSNFSKEVFLNMGVPAEKQVVIPHGINLEDYKSNKKFELKTKKSKKILLNVAQPHKRKALHLALESFGKAFSKDDDVCLVAKVFTKNKGNSQFDVDFYQILKDFKKQFPNHAEIEVVTDYIQDIVEIYNACDVNFSGTFAECWHLPSLEALAAGIVNVVPNYGGQLDFLNENNSLLISGKIVRAPRDHQYWEYNPFAVHFQIDTDDAAEKLKLAIKENDILKDKFSSHSKETCEKFTWQNVANLILEQCD